MKTTYSTVEVAKRIGVHRVTLQRWLSADLVRPSIQIPLKGRTLWRWTKADVARARRVKAEIKPGPKPKKARRRNGAL